jgi:hypothetical protein
MEKRYQVFVSSTFADLTVERQAVIQGLLSLDHFPAGMEQFPASDEDAWALIRGVIDDSDYYLLVVGGRYGSINQEGISYTEMEFDYATAKKKPILAFLHAERTAFLWEKRIRMMLFKRRWKPSRRKCRLSTLNTGRTQTN